MCPGHRTYEGAKKTMPPDLKLLAELFLNTIIDCTEFQGWVKQDHINQSGNVKSRQVKQSLHTYPACVYSRSFGITQNMWFIQTRSFILNLKIHFNWPKYGHVVNLREVYVVFYMR